MADNFAMLHESMKCDLGNHMSLFARPVLAGHGGTVTERLICPITIGHLMEATLDSGRHVKLALASLVFTNHLQMNAPQPHFCSPLVSLIISEVPFERVAMHLVRPLPKSTGGH